MPPNGKNNRVMKSRARVGLIILSYFLVFSALDLLRHFSCTQNSNDVAVFDQSLWSFLHGRGFYNSIEGMNHFGVHNSPILFLILPVYFLFQSPVTLILCQAAAGAAAIIPVFLIGKKILGEEAGVFFALLFALYHPLHGVTWDLLNELCYVVAPLLFAVYGLITERWGIMWLGLVLAAACKEEIGFVAGFFGIYAAALGAKQSRKTLISQGILLFLLGTCWSLFSVDALIPHFRGGPYQYLSAENRYAAFGNSMGGVFAGLAKHPWLAVKTVFTRPKVFYCIELLAPLAFFSLVTPAPLFIAIPSLAANLLSNSPMMSMVGARYPAAIIPFVFVAAMYGTKKIMEKSNDPEKTFKKITRTQLAFTLLCTLFLSSTPLRLRFVNAGPLVLPGFKIPPVTRHCAIARQIAGEIPAGARVSTQPNFTAHIRHGCEVYPFFRSDANYVLLDPSFPQGYRDSGMTPSQMEGKGYILKVSEDGVMLFGK